MTPSAPSSQPPRGCVSLCEPTNSRWPACGLRPKTLPMPSISGSSPASANFSAAEDQPQLAQAGPERPSMGPMDRMGGPMGAREGRHGWMRQMMQMSPQQRCEERLARRAGGVAYLVAKLNFNDQQKPLWDK